MDVKGVWVPEALICSENLTAAAKVVWMALHLDADVKPGKLLSPARLAARTHLSRPTVYRALKQLNAQGWNTPSQSDNKRFWSKSGGKMVGIPAEVVTAADLSPQAKVVYGAVQLRPAPERPVGEFTYGELAKKMHLSYKTISRALRNLLEIGWVIKEKKGRKARYTAQDEFVTPHCQSELRRVQNLFEREFGRDSNGEPSSLDGRKSLGEAIAQEIASLVVDSDRCFNNAWPSFLVNPKTGERMEFDWYIPHSVALEFHGPHHDRVIGDYTAKEVAKQRERDRIKQRTCEERGIALVVIRPEELSLEAISAKLGAYLPLRDLRGYKPMVSLLTHKSFVYRNMAERNGWISSVQGGLPA